MFFSDKLPFSHNMEWALAPLDGAPQPRPDTHHHHRAERTSTQRASLGLGCQFQPLVFFTHQRQQMIVLQSDT